MINPDNTTTVRVGELPPEVFSLTDNIPHEVGTELKRGTVQQFADFIASVIETGSGLAFNPTTVPNGGTLPATTSNEWILVGKGTFHNVGGGSDIVTTEELNALTSNGTTWSLGVEIPINVEFAGITQNIRSGYTSTTPSEDAVFNRIAEIVSMFSNYTPNGGYSGSSQDIVDLANGYSLKMIDYPRLLAEQTDFELPEGTTAIFAKVNYNTTYLPETANLTGELNQFTQDDTTVIFNQELETGNYVAIFYKQI